MRARVAMLVGLLVVLAACSAPSASPASAGAPSAAPSAATMNPSPAAEATPGPIPSGLTLLAAPWLPPWADEATPAEVVERPLVPYCGLEEIEQGDPNPWNAAVRQCFFEEATAGRAVEFATIYPTTEGDLIADIYSFDPSAGTSVYYDATQDAWGSGTWSVRICRPIIPDPKTVFTFSACDDEREVR